ETDGEHDELFEEALRICVEMKRASTSVLQRRLRIGYGRAAAILDIMEREGLIGQADGSRPRPVLGRAYEIVAQWDEGGGEEEIRGSRFRFQDSSSRFQVRSELLSQFLHLKPETLNLPRNFPET